MALALHFAAAPSAGSVAADVRLQPPAVASHNCVYLSGRANAKRSPAQLLTVTANHGQDGTIKVERPKEREYPGQRFKEGLLSHRRRRGDYPPLRFDSWDPFSVGGLRQMMDMIDGFFLDAAPFGSPSRGSGGRALRTPWDVAEDAEAFYIRVDMPGFDKDDVKVTVEDGILVIKGERDPEAKIEDRWASKTYRNFNTKLTLPEDSQLDNVTAELKNGVLNVVVPKMKPEDRKQVIDVQVS